jgi:UDP-N-acetyl-D-mannosaminuronic acid dehydrogenase
LSIACFGLSFKPDIDDLRESPAVRIVEQLSKLLVADILVVEPHIGRLPAQLVESARTVSAEVAIQNADIIVILVSHKAFKDLNFDECNAFEVIDACGIVR